MKKTIIISNRLPVTVFKNEDGEIEYKESIGGLSTGLTSIHEKENSLWIGWPGIADEALSENEKSEITEILRKKYKSYPVFLAQDEIHLYYEGFCNNTIWPLFHYFLEKTEYDYLTWEIYQLINNRFFETIKLFMEPEDVVWVHDYQLMLLPEMIKTSYTSSQIGFFLHIPFPSPDIFRLLIWRTEILKGLLGSDLIGFHTYGYVKNFLECTRGLLGLQDSLNRIEYDNRLIQVGTFPMGIDYQRFNHFSIDDLKSDNPLENVNLPGGARIILSIDRLDYTKGIPERLAGYERFLENFSQYREKVVLLIIVAPSRELVDSYEILLREINEHISRINGKYGTLGWMPIWFFYQSFPQDELLRFYRIADVLLVTPLRDGMNLVVKEYIASRYDFGGMAVISETAGAAKELGEAIIVNPNDSASIAEGIHFAIEMDAEERIERNKIMHTRLERYNVDFWATHFITALEESVAFSKDMDHTINADIRTDYIKEAYEHGKKRLILLDYDGTLVGFHPVPAQARPDKELLELLHYLASSPGNTVVIISGRDRDVLSTWFNNMPLHLMAAHGLWSKCPEESDWNQLISLDKEWKDVIRTILQLYTDSIPGSIIEEKEYSLAWHYRQCDPEFVNSKLQDIKETINAATHSSTIGLQYGNKVLEIKDVRYNKGYGIMNYLNQKDYDFILGIGDDYTDEDMFSALPDTAFSIKVGSGNTHARYRTKSWKSVRRLLRKLI